MAVVVAELLALLKLDKGKFEKDMKSAKDDVDDFGTRLGKAGSKLTDFGNKMTLATAPLAIGLGIAVQQTKEFDTVMTNVNTILGLTGTEAANLRAEILAYGGETAFGPIAVAEAYNEIAGGVEDATTHMAILDAAVQAAVAGQADLTSTTNALIATMNSYGFAAGDAAMVSDVFTQTVGMGVLSMDELAAAMPQVAGLAASLNIPIENLGAQMAYLTTQGFSAGNSATYLKSMMTTLLAPTASLQTAIEALGYDTGEAMLNNLGLVGSYEALKAYNNGTFAGLITNQEALQGATALTKDTFSEFNTTFQDTVAGSTAAAVSIQEQNTSWGELQAKLQEAAILIGSQLTPVIISLIDTAIIPAITSVTDWMTANPELTQTLILMTGAAIILGPVISAVGTAVSVVTGIVGLATSAWAGIQALWAAAPAIIAAVQGGVAALGATMMTTVGPILAVGAAIAGVIMELRNFINTVNTAKAAAQSALKDELAEGVVTRKQLDDTAFGATAAQFGGGVVGDVIARLTYSNVADAVEGRAVGGGVNANTPYMVGEDGPELFVPDSSGEIVPNGGGGMGAPVINVYQQPGEDGAMLADRIAGLMVSRGILRAA